MSILMKSIIGSRLSTFGVRPVTSSSAKRKPWPASSAIRASTGALACTVSITSSTTFSRGRKTKMSLMMHAASTLMKPCASPITFSSPSWPACAITAAVADKSVSIWAPPAGALRNSSS